MSTQREIGIATVVARPLGSMLSATVMVAAVLVFSGCAETRSPINQQGADEMDSGSTESTDCPAPPGVSGRIAVASAAVRIDRVDLYAEPRPAKVKVGGVEKSPHLGSSRVGEGGCYAIDWPPASRMRRAADAGGILNLRLVVPSGDQVTMREFPGFLSRTAAGFVVRGREGVGDVRLIGPISDEEQQVTGWLHVSLDGVGFEHSPSGVPTSLGGEG